MVSCPWLRGRSQAFGAVSCVSTLHGSWPQRAEPEDAANGVLGLAEEAGPL